MAEMNNPVELVKVLDDDRMDGDLFVFEQAAYRLWKLGEMAVDALQAAVNRGSQMTCIQAAYLLGNIGTDRALQALTRALEDENSSLRKYAAEYEPWQNDEQAAKNFYLHLYRRPIEWRIEDTVGDEVVKTLVEAMNTNELPRDEVRALAKIGDNRVIEPLITALRIEDDKIFHDAFYGLLKIGKAAVKPLIARLEDESLRQSAAWLLGAIGDKRAVKPLINVLNAQEAQVRVIVIAALGDLRDKRAVEPLKQSLNDEDEWIRRAVIISLGQIGEKNTLPVIVSALDDTSRVVQLSAAEVLAELGDDRARGKLEELAATEWREAAQNALRRLAREPDAPSVFDREYSKH